MSECDRCGAFVSAAYRRVFARRDGSLPGCPECGCREHDTHTGSHVGSDGALSDVDGGGDP